MTKTKRPAPRKIVVTAASLLFVGLSVGSAAATSSPVTVNPNPSPQVHSLRASAPSTEGTRLDSARWADEVGGFAGVND